MVDNILHRNDPVGRGPRAFINNMILRRGSRHSNQRRQLLAERYRVLVQQNQVQDGGLEMAERRLNEYELRTKRYRRPPVDEGETGSTLEDGDPTTSVPLKTSPLSENGGGNDCDDSDDNEAELEHACTICFGELKDGDKIGDLPCGHAFHVGTLFRCFRMILGTLKPITRIPDAISPFPSSHSFSFSFVTLFVVVSV